MSLVLNIANGPARAATTFDDAAVWVRGLAKRYGEIEAVRGIDFEVRDGETFGFLGPAPARPTGGSARVAGHDVVAERDEVRRNIGLVFRGTTSTAT